MVKHRHGQVHRNAAKGKSSLNRVSHHGDSPTKSEGGGFAESNGRSPCRSVGAKGFNPILCADPSACALSWQECLMRVGRPPHPKEAVSIASGPLAGLPRCSMRKMRTRDALVTKTGSLSRITSRTFLRRVIGGPPIGREFRMRLICPRGDRPLAGEMRGRDRPKLFPPKNALRKCTTNEACVRDGKAGSEDRAR